MSYNFLQSSPTYGQTQKQVYTDLFQASLNREFYDATDIWTIQEEIPFASQIYNNVDVRIVTHVINSATGKARGDDWKKLLFKDLGHSVGIGFLYTFDDSTWITINSERTKNLAASTYVRRCDNVLRWIDDSGNLYSEPCIVDYQILRNRDSESPSGSIVLPAGTVEVICQFNNRTNLIKANQRFLFGNQGNWTAYRVEGGGVNNYQNVHTYDNYSVGFIVLTVRLDYITENDDLVNGIADANKMLYSISVEEEELTAGIGQAIQFHCNVFLNGETVTRDVVWNSSDSKSVSIDDTGLATVIKAPATCLISCALSGNPNIYSTATLYTVSAVSDLYEIIITPSDNFVLEGDTKTYSVNLYKNNVIQSDACNISLDWRSVPTSNFEFAQDSYSFSIRNMGKYFEDYLQVNCSDINNYAQKSISIFLKGAW